MTKEELRARAIALHDDFTHRTNDRRAFMADMARLAGSAGAANALLGTIAASPAAAAIVPADDKRLRTSTPTWSTGEGRTMGGYMAVPATAKGRLPTIIVIHENRGLNEHIRDVARRVALAGHVALAPDFLSPVGGTPADEDAARDAIGKLDYDKSVADGVATAKWLKQSKQGNGKVGVVGFCWGGAMTNRLAVAAGTDVAAAAPYYGPPPPPSEAAKVRAAMLLHYAGNDARVNAGAQPWIDALKAAKVPVTAYFYEGAEHAFNNDTAGVRYNAAVAKLAWDRTLAFFKANLSA